MDGFCFLFVLRLTFIQIFGFWVFVEIKWGRVEQSATAIKPPMTDGQGGYLKQTCTNRTVGITQLSNRRTQWRVKPTLRIRVSCIEGKWHPCFHGWLLPPETKYSIVCMIAPETTGKPLRWVTPSRCWIVIAAEQKLLLRSHCCQVSLVSLIRSQNSCPLLLYSLQTFSEEWGLMVISAKAIPH